MPKLLSANNNNGEIEGYYFDCPGCKSGHFVHVKPHQAPNGASWNFNNDLEKPTFSPSILSQINYQHKPTSVCHLFVIDGMINFLNDCTHELAGQTVAMENVDE